MHLALWKIISESTFVGVLPSLFLWVFFRRPPLSASLGSGDETLKKGLCCGSSVSATGALLCGLRRRHADSEFQVHSSTPRLRLVLAAGLRIEGFKQQISRTFKRHFVVFGPVLVELRFHVTPWHRYC